MKRLLLILTFIPVFSFSQYTTIPDKNFEQALIGLGYDDVIDSKVLTANIIYVDSLYLSKKNIKDLTGIDAFTDLTFLICDNNQLTSLDVSKNKALNYLDCSFNSLTSLDLSYNNAYTYLGCLGNQLTKFGYK
tara:strand:+ start:93 stop:491 length:399 start_codon:yes stop_codon:yes gene_type:complete